MARWARRRHDDARSTLINVQAHVIEAAPYTLFLRLLLLRMRVRMRCFISGSFRLASPQRRSLPRPRSLARTLSRPSRSRIARRATT